MSTQAVEEGNRYTIERDDDLDCVIFTWTMFASGEEFRQGANALLEYIRDNDVTKLIIDSSGIDAHDDADKEWLQREWTPKLIEEGIEYNAVVHSTGAIAQMDIQDMRENLRESMEEMPYDPLWTDDMEEAREWIKEQ